MSFYSDLDSNLEPEPSHMKSEDSNTQAIILRIELIDVYKDLSKN